MREDDRHGLDRVESRAHESRPDREGRIEVRGLSKTFPGMSRPALDGVDLIAEPGQLIDVMGPSGSGKSTLVMILNGLEAADQGQVLIAGRDMSDVPPAGRPTATVFQQDNLFPDLTVFDNVAYPLRAARLSPLQVADQAEVMLLRLGLAGLERAYSHELSRGQRRRVALARALVSQPRVLLLDEPLSGLDQALKAVLLDLIDGLRRRLGTTVVHVTHEPGLALATADRIVVLDHGRVAGAGTPRQMYQHPANSFVAEFLGRSSFLDAETLGPVPPCGPGDDRRARIRVLGNELVVPVAPGVTVEPGHTATLLVRPHCLQIHPLGPTGQRDEVGCAAREPRQERGSAPHGLVGIVQEVRYRGETMEYLIETEQGSLLGTGDLWSEPLARHQMVSLKLAADHLWLLA
ncbi:ABC transporter ATP-binding protein [Acidipropionibacterium thoenii]|uniref:ABC transporter ATP-binding protein n=1 Tax=Acidipropionibacterium thoenii TaxID=1751 RepID=UPI000407AD6F|nr:ABC transporter ATP-binding protein [Acidipropionibacterium thoenii]